jgi:alpha-glucosidase
MKPRRWWKILTLLLLLLLAAQCKKRPNDPEPLYVASPDGLIRLGFVLLDGTPHYTVTHSDREIIKPSKLGFSFQAQKPLGPNLTLVETERGSFDETWTQPWGEVKEIRDHYNELRVDLEETGGSRRKMSLRFRVYNDGIGFRYELPEQENLGAFEITAERTEFALTGNHQAWWIPAYERDRYEYLYRASPISFLRGRVEAVHTPLTFKIDDDLYLSIHEAALTDYAAMTLKPQQDNTFSCDLVPWSDGVKVKGQTALVTPWRTVQIATAPGDLITSYLILNLNEPNRLGDVSWVKPAKYVGIWWGMHIGIYTWGPGDRHGATTENAKSYIDFAAKNGFSAVLVEGWNEGWDGEWAQHGERFDFTTSYSDFDLQAVATYAASRGIKLIGHHETGAAISNYEDQLEAAFSLDQDLGIDTVKTGYVGWGQGIRRYDEDGRLAGLEWHHGQFMVRHYRKVVETAAQYHIMLDVHEPIKDTGIRRTYPNMMTREGARGQEYNAWSGDGGNPPEHTTILPFTRMLAGPMDFTPGIFDLLFEEARPGNRVNTTLAKQLALYVVLYSPLQMAADLPENYDDHPALQFIRDVPVDWQDTRVLGGEIGEYITIARQERDGEDWYMGSITDENARSLTAPLTFLRADTPYVAEIYADGPGADWRTNPLAVEISRSLVDRETVLTLDLAPGGGQAIRLRPASDEDLSSGND